MGINYWPEKNKRKLNFIFKRKKSFQIKAKKMINKFLSIALLIIAPASFLDESVCLNLNTD